MSIDSAYACAYCGQCEAPVRHKVKEMMFGTAEAFEVGECTACGSLQLLDMPKDLSPYYPESYYSLKPLVRSGILKKFLKRIRYRLFLSGFSFLKPVFGQWMLFTGMPRKARIADIGCGNGQLLYEMYMAGFSNLEGYDPFISEDRILGKGIRLYKKPIKEMQGPYDMIMMHHALEHMYPPSKIFKKSYELLRKGGTLLVRIPVADAQVWKQEGANWVQLDVPRHLHIPSVSGIKMLAGEVGLRLQAFDFDSTEFQFWGTALYKKGVALMDAGESYFSEQELKAFRQKALLYNQQGLGDQVCFYFVRED
jgi:SAM-dependent methyltransferase